MWSGGVGVVPGILPDWRGAVATPPVPGCVWPGPQQQPPPEQAMGLNSFRFIMGAEQ
jgi:hypothetical protein